MSNNFFNKLNEELNENAFQQAGQFLSWAKSKFLNTFKTLGFGIAKTANRLFNLFDKKGNKLLKRDVKSITMSKDSRVVTIQDPGLFLQLSSSPNIPSLGIKKTQAGAIIKVYNKTNKGVNEWIDTGIESNTNDPFDSEEPAKPVIEPIEITIAHVDYKSLEDALDDVLDSMSINDKNKVISIVGDSGIGKTEIVKNLAKERGLNFFYVELGKIDRSLITGISAIDTEYSEDEQGNKKSTNKISLLMAKDMFPREDIIKEYEKGTLGVEIANANSNKWIIFLDEFNRAPTKVTSVIMNLFLDGQITAAVKSVYDPKTKKHISPNDGGSLKLPKNTLYIVGMNETAQAGTVSAAFNDLEPLDIATTSRLLQSFILNPTAEAWNDNYAITPAIKNYDKKDVIVYPIIPQTLMQIIKKLDRKYDKTGGVFKIMYANSVDNLASMDPRRWSAISDRYYELAWSMWKKLPESTRNSNLFLKNGYQLYKRMSETHESATSNLDAKTSKMTLRKWRNIIDKYEEIDKEEIAKEFAFSAWATANWHVTKEILNDRNIASMFGVGLPGDDGTSREENIKAFRREMFSILVKEANASISSEDLFFGYNAIKDGNKSPELSKIATKIQNVYSVDPTTGKKSATNFETMEIAQKITSFFSSVGIGDEKKYYVDTVTFKSGNNSIPMVIPGNVFTALNIINNSAKNKLTLTDFLDQSKIIDFNKSKKYPMAKNVFDKLNGIQKNIADLKGYDKVIKIMEESVRSALLLVSDGVLNIVKDFSDRSEDIVEAIISKLKQSVKTFDNKSKIDDEYFSNNKIDIKLYDNTYFTKSFSDLLILSLQNNKEFQEIGGTKSTKKRTALKKAASEVETTDLPEAIFINKLKNQLWG